MFDNSPEALFLMKHFSAFYKNNFIDSVPSVPAREFGFGVFRRKIANRNMSFSSVGEMNSFLRESAPLFFSYSNSYYKFPSRTPMQLKEWIKSDLIYEFDADELGLEVKEINGVQWFEKNHLEEAKRQVFRLIDFVEKDFGFPSSEISLNFSGKAGFHVHFRSEKIQTLNKKARIELVDYLTAHNIDYINLGINFETLSFPKPAGLWQKRIIEGVKEFFMQDTKRICAVTGFAPKKVSPLVRDKSALLDSLTKGVLMQVEGRKSGEFWKKVLDFVVAKERCPIDRQTSVDLHKIIRVPATLHGETGFLAKTIPLESLKDFNPFNDAVAFGNEKIKVRVIECPAFELNSQSFGPFKDSVEELPLFAAVYLIGKGSALLL